MKGRKLRPAFVLTVATIALAGCKEQQIQGGPTRTRNPPEPTTPSTGPVPSDLPMASATPSASAAAAPRKRKVRDPRPEWKYREGPLDWAHAEALNPHDASGRVVYAGADGSCFVKLPPEPGTPIGPPGMDLSKPLAVDCSDAMQDPAWDTCLGETLYRQPNGQCFCPHTGNPPPPPTVAECPRVKP